MTRTLALALILAALLAPARAQDSDPLADWRAQVRGPAAPAAPAEPAPAAAPRPKSPRPKVIGFPPPADAMPYDPLGGIKAGKAAADAKAADCVAALLGRHEADLAFVAEKLRAGATPAEGAVMLDMLARTGGTRAAAIMACFRGE